VESRPAAAKKRRLEVNFGFAVEAGLHQVAATPASKDRPPVHLAVERPAMFRRLRKTQTQADSSRRSVGI
jgi:hypothetical protein